MLLITNINFLLTKTNYSNINCILLQFLINRLMLIQLLKEIKEWCRTCCKATPRGTYQLVHVEQVCVSSDWVPVGRSGEVYIGSQGVAPWPCGASWPPGKGTPGVHVNKNFSTVSERCRTIEKEKKGWLHNFLKYNK